MKTAINYGSNNLLSTLGNLIAGGKEVAAANQLQLGYLYLFQDVTGGYYGFSDLGYDMDAYGTPAGSPFLFYGWELVFAWPQIEMQAGSQDSKCDITCFPVIDNPSVSPYGTRFISGFQQGLFDGCQFWVYQAVLNGYGNVVGLAVAYSGFIGQVKVVRSKISFEGHSLLQFANVRVPKNMYQPGCSHALYDAGCGVPQANYLFTTTISAIDAGYPLQQLHVVDPGYFPQSYFQQGYVKFLTGLNVGLSRTIKYDAVTAWYLCDPFPNVPNVGDTVIAYPGCDKTQAMCASRFNNLANFRGFPYLPLETIYY